MKDERKKKSQLIEELNDLRQQLAELKNEAKQYSETVESSLKATPNSTAILEKLSDAIILMDMDFIVHSWNKGAQKLYGWESHEAAGKPFRDLVSPDYSEKSREYMLEIFLNNGEYIGDMIHHHRDGRPIRVWTSVSMLLDSHGKPIGALAVNRDITEYYEMQTQLLLANQRLHYLLSATSAVIYTARASGDFGATFVSDSVTRALGYEPNEFTEDSSFWIEHIHPEDIAQINAQLPVLFDIGTLSYEYRFLHKNGDYVWMRDEMKLVKDDQGELIEIVGYWIDVTARKEAEKALARERDLLKAVMENTCTCQAYLDAEFNFVVVNSNYANNSGYTVDELIGRNHFDLFPNEENLSNFVSARDTEEPVRFHDRPFEFANQPERGTTYWDWTLAPVKDSLGTIQGFVLSMDETTDRVRAEKGLKEYQNLLENRVQQRTSELSRAIDSLKKEIHERRYAEQVAKESEQNYRELAERSLDGFARVDMQGRIIESNSALQNMLGYTDEELSQLNLTDLTPPKWHEVEKEMLSLALRDGYSPLWQKEYIRKDGSVFPAELRLYLTKDRQGDPTGTWRFVHDITERVKSREDLEKSESRLSEAQSIAHLGNWEWDILSNDLWWSDEVFRIFGVSPNDFKVTYDKFIEFVHPEDREHVKSAVEAALHEGKPYGIDHRIVRTEGEPRVVHERGIVSFNGEGKPVRMVGTVLDVTELKETERRLRTLSQRLLQIQEDERQKIGRELHDQVGQTATVLKMLIDRAIKAPDLQIGDIIIEAESVANELIEEIRELSSELHPRVLDDLGLIPALIWYIERLSTRTTVKIDFKHSGLRFPLPPQVINTAFRIIQESLTNTIRHAQVNEVILRVWVNNDRLMLLIQDYGVGFDPTKIDVYSSSGLSSIQERTELIGGDYILETSPGEGTLLTVSIPITRGSKTNGEE